MRTWVLFGLLAVTAAPAAAAQEGDSARGLAYVRSHCADCHAVEAGTHVSADPAVPAFQAVADIPGMTQMALAAWLQMPHKNMPQLVVPGDKIADISAYLYSIKRKKR